jgi:hypothetical protein
MNSLRNIFFLKELPPLPPLKKPNQNKQKPKKTTTAITKLTNKSKIKNKIKTITVCHSTKMKELIVNYQQLFLIYQSLPCNFKK